MRLNLDIDVRPKGEQKCLGFLGLPSEGPLDLAAYPNGRRPGDDTVDFTLRVALGKIVSPTI